MRQNKESSLYFLSFDAHPQIYPSSSLISVFSVSSPPLTPTSPGTPTPPMTPISPGAPAGAAKHTCNHLHTIGGPGGHKNICTRCSQKKWPLMRRPSPRKAENRRSHQGEVTVLAVGRWAGLCECVSEARRQEQKGVCSCSTMIKDAFISWSEFAPEAH